MSIRRKPEFDRFTAGLSRRVNVWLNDEDYNPQDLINLVRSELCRIWKYLIEKINNQEKEIETLRTENEELKKKLKVAIEALGFYADINSWERIVVSSGPFHFQTEWASNLKEKDCALFNTGGGRARLTIKKISGAEK